MGRKTTFATTHKRMNVIMQTVQGLGAKRNVTTGQNFVMITSQLKNQIDARIKGTRLEGRPTAESSLFKANVVKREHLLHSKCFSGCCANLQFTQARRKFYVSSVKRNVLISPSIRCCSHQFRSFETSRC